MDRRSWIKVLALVVVLAGVAVGASFNWTANGDDDRWDTCGNWDACATFYEWPSASNDDATFPNGGANGNSDDWQVEMVHFVGGTIDDLTIAEDLYVTKADGESGGVTVYFDSVYITGTNEDVQLQVTGEVRLVGVTQ
jgi:hypothetical protein